ncbi:MAG: serine hydrolase [Chloroflexi bacterium]|nr:serine hydrolase [Chloroflexota bacterium]MDA1146274.1 serine hydrolase [Chloroflexota bacterium]
MADPVIEAVVPDLEARIQQTMADQRVVGLAIGIVRGQELAWSGGFGHADFEDARPPDEHSLFRFDSNTKPMTAMAVMQLRDEGLLNIDDPLVEYVPEFARVQQVAGKVEDVTLRRLMTHRSGLSGEVPGDWHSTGVGPTIQYILDHIDETGIVIPPDSQHKYCNLGFALLGEVVARLSGRPYAEYIQSALLEPLGMTGSTFEPEQGEHRRVTQYAWSTTTSRPGPARDLVFNDRKPAGGLHSTIADMARWMSLQFRRDRELERGGAQVLRGTTLREMHRLQYSDDDWTDGWCIGFSGVRRGEHVYLGHGGGNPGSLSRTVFNLATETAVIVATNSDGHTAQTDIALGTLDRLMAAADAQPAPLPARPSAPPEWATRFIGAYHSAAGETGYGGPRRVAWVDDSLALLGPGVGLPRTVAWSGGAPMPCHLDPTDDPLVLKARNGRLAGELLHFRETANGAIDGFTSIGVPFHRIRIDH